MSNDFVNRQIGRFQFNEATRQFKTIWQYPKGLNDTLYAKVSSLDKEHKMTLSGIMGHDTLSMELLKIKVKAVSIHTSLRIYPIFDNRFVKRNPSTNTGI